MESKVLILESSESIRKIFREQATSGSNILEVEPSDFWGRAGEDFPSIKGVFLNISNLSSEDIDLSSYLLTLSKKINTSARLYAYSYSQESSALLLKWGARLLRPMSRDFLQDVKSAFMEIDKIHERALECKAVKSDCSSCRYNDCNGVIKGSELYSAKER